MTLEPNPEPVTIPQILSRGLRRRCPNCGGPLVFGRGMRIAESCPQCGMRWWRDGFYLGALVVNYSATVFGLLLLVVLATLHGWLSPSVAVPLSLFIAVVFPWLFYKWSWSLWLASYYGVLPGELPANLGHNEPELRE